MQEIDLRETLSLDSVPVVDVWKCLMAHARIGMSQDPCRFDKGLQLQAGAVVAISIV